MQYKGYEIKWVQIVAKKLHLHPLNLKSKVSRPRRGRWEQEHDEIVVEK